MPSSPNFSPEGIKAAHAAGRISDAEALTLLRHGCQGDGTFWLRFVLTRDEADAGETVKPFPGHLGYLLELWRVLADRRLIVIAKSRQMLVSWAVAAFCVWVARSKPHQAVYWQAQKDKDAIQMVSMPKGGVLGRCQFIESNLPEWLRIDTQAQEGRLTYPHGSFIQALAGGADQIRGKVATVYVGDEFAHMEDQQGVYTSVAPLIQKGAKAIFVSTPNGSTNQFSVLYHGRPMQDMRMNPSG